MIKETPEGQTHYENDGCGMPEHNKPRSSMKETIKIHSLMLLNLYGVEEQKVKDNPQALNTFVNLLEDEIMDKSQIEEIPVMRGTLEALDRLTIRK